MLLRLLLFEPVNIFKLFIMSKSISCSASYGTGGLGLHFTQIIEDVRSRGNLAQYYTTQIKKGDSHGNQVINPLTQYLKYMPVCRDLGWRNYFEGDLFDRAVANKLSISEEFQGFGGQSLYSFQKARQLGCQSLILTAANSHVNNVLSQHKKAIRGFGLEKSWLNESQWNKTILEYQEADIIEVVSEYTRRSFLNAGISEHKLSRKILKIPSRFKPQKYVEDDTFRVVYVGSLTVMKGIPNLIEAFSRFPDQQARLTLVGGWASRGMRKYIQSWLAKDSRIQVLPGDPLPHLQKASVYVHPTYEDGFAYAPMEALACGVPVIVTEDTGMKEYVKEGSTGYVVPTGNWESILEHLVICKNRNLRGEMG